jgi:hypothetical protein
MPTGDRRSTRSASGGSKPTDATAEKWLGPNLGYEPED